MPKKMLLLSLGADSGAQKKECSQKTSQYKITNDELEELCLSYRKRILEDEELPNEETKRTQKRFRVSIDSNRITEFVDQFEGSKCLVMENSQWEALMSLMRAGRVSFQTYPFLVESVKAANRLDVLIEIVKSVFDISISDIYDILLFLLKSDYSSPPQKYQILGQSLVSNSSNLSSNKQNSKICKRLTAGMMIRLFVETTLQRSTAYTLVEISEASKNLPLDIATLLLRLLVFLTRSVYSSSSLVSSESAVLERATVWICGILDGQMGNIIIATKHSTQHRQLFEAMIKSIDLAKENIVAAESALKYSSQIRRFCVLAEKHLAQNQSGVYEIEQLDL